MTQNNTILCSTIQWDLSGIDRWESVALRDLWFPFHREGFTTLGLSQVSYCPSFVQLVSYPEPPSTLRTRL